MTANIFSLRLVAAALSAVLAAAAGDALAHPWHRPRRDDAGTTTKTLALETAAPAAATDGPDPADTVRPGPPPVDPRFFLAAARAPGPPAAADIAAAFAPFEKLGAVSCRRDDRFFFVESSGIPGHPLMVGIRAWQQQVPLPQRYVGDNAWRIPLHPVPAARPLSTKGRFLRGAIALAVNGVPIFNPLNNRGEDAFLIGELDEYGGHCGRADDYHYHVAPVHLQKQVGKGMPIAYALDGYPIYGTTEPDGTPARGLDACGGHEDAAGNYHYHATKTYPYLNGGFHGEVTERDGQVDPQPRAEPVREALPPLRGAKIVGFSSPTPSSRLLTYEVGGRTGTVAYTLDADGGVAFTYTDPAGKTTTQTARPRGGGGGRREDAGRPPRPAPGGRRAGTDGRPPRQEAAAAGRLAVTSPAIGADGLLPVDFTCDGAGVSPPLEWQAGPPGTRSYCLVLWHEAPDKVKSYWIVHGIPASATRLERAARDVGTVGLNDKGRAEYDPMCSKGPGAKTYHVTVYAVSGDPALPAKGADREALLAAITDMTLAEGTLTFTFDRGTRR